MTDFGVWGVGGGMLLSERDRRVLAWIGEQYTVRMDLLTVVMAQLSDDPTAKARGRITQQTVSRRDADSDVAFWRTRPRAERVALVQVLRAEYLGWDDAEAGPRLERVHRVLRRP